jgi:hypothetical protein
MAKTVAIKAKRSKAKRSNEEDRMQIALVGVFKLRRHDDWLMHHSPNAGKRSDIAGVRLKALGMQPGWPDLEIISPDGLVHFIELKTAKGALSEAQRAFREDCIRTGRRYALCRSFKEAEAALMAWGAMRAADEPIPAHIFKEAAE